MKLIKIVIGILVVFVVLAICVTLGSPKPQATAPVVISTANSSQAQDAPSPAPIKVTVASTSPAIGKVGETVAQGDYRLTVTKVDTAKNFGDFSQAAAGNKLVAVELLIESAADAGVSINPLFYAKLKDADGYEYAAAAAGKEPSLKAQNNLPKGDKVRGWVTFEVPETAKGLVLSYKPLTGGDEINLRVDLGE